MRKNVVGFVWLAGLLLAAVVYRVGPDNILYGGIQALDDLRASINGLLAAFAVNTYDVMRALTLGLLPVFVILGLLAHRRGHRVARPMLVVGVLALLLLYQPAHEGWYVSSTRWTVAFVVVAIGCAVMTRRVATDAGEWRAAAAPAATWRWTRPLG